jgi:hypothetical protein
VQSLQSKVEALKEELTTATSRVKESNKKLSVASRLFLGNVI